MSSHRNPIIIILWNATTVKNKISELHKFLIDHNADIAIIIEIWLTPEYPKDTVKLSNYKIHRQDGPPYTKPRGGAINSCLQEHSYEREISHLKHRSTYHQDQKHFQTKGRSSILPSPS